MLLSYLDLLFGSYLIDRHLIPNVLFLIRIPLQRSGKDFTIVKVLPSGVYQYRFIADGQWRYAPDLPWAQDDSGNAYNILDLQVKTSVFCTPLLMNGSRTSYYHS